MLYFLAGDTMSDTTRTLTTSSTAARIRELAARHQVNYLQTPTDMLANEITRLSDDTVSFDEIECLLVALQRAGHITRNDAVQLQAQYLRETKS
jgi:hypothetical protein